MKIPTLVDKVLKRKKTPNNIYILLCSWNQTQLNVLSGSNPPVSCDKSMRKSTKRQSPISADAGGTWGGGGFQHITGGEDLTSFYSIQIM